MGVSITAKQGQRGFTILEFLIVTLVISILASIAMPNLHRAQKSANEASAIQSMRTIVSAQESFRLRQSQAGYGALAELSKAGVLRSDMSGGFKSGYTFVMAPLPESRDTYVCIGMPQSHAGDRWFFVDSSGVIRYREGDMPDQSSPPLD